MMRSIRRTLPVSGILLVFGATTAIGGDEPLTLSNNPFTRPPSRLMTDEKLVLSGASPSRWSYELRATLIGQKERYANVAGEILAIGDKFEGFELVAVEENKATFSKYGEQISVFVRAENQRQEATNAPDN